ncbi:MAG: META domain-containing protein [Actinomycetota bacterium]|nr:META domain-containing protein [Actinomycetota bacterium]
MMTNLGIGLLLATCLFATCTGDPSPAPPEAAAPATPPKAAAPATSDNDPAPYERIWALDSGRGPAGDIPILDEWDITLEIDGPRVSGRSACNSYGGKVTISRSSFDVGGLAGTEIDVRATSRSWRRDTSTRCRRQTRSLETATGSRSPATTPS